MDYLIRRATADLDSTGYMEIGPGRYTGKHWQPGFLFVWEDAFGMAEGILATHFPAYDHFSMNDVPKEIGMKVVDEWLRAAKALRNCTSEEAAKILRLDAPYRTDLEKEISAKRDAISVMLDDLANACRAFYQAGDWVCVLGI